jgi:transcriptional antiterminator RfaH|tara:strand:- start:23557 stop:24078 length:522 start_codon:yes stop_codon:yes gene_type:complete
MELSEDCLELSWYLAQFKPNCAMIAKRNLVRQGFKVFLPLETQTRVKRSKFVEETKPFFPGYLFVGASNRSGSAHAVHSTYGISQLVRFGTKTAIVPKPLVKELQSRCDSNDIIVQNSALKKGQKVRVTHGLFANLIGEVERTAADRRVWLLLDLIGRKTKVSISQSALQSKV